MEKIDIIKALIASFLITILTIGISFFVFYLIYNTNPLKMILEWN